MAETGHRQLPWAPILVLIIPTGLCLPWYGLGPGKNKGTQTDDLSVLGPGDNLTSRFEEQKDDGFVRGDNLLFLKCP